MRLRVKDWDTMQHYKDRSPKWVKLYTDLLCDYAFTRLPDEARWHLTGIWMLASATKDGSIPADPTWVQHRLMSTSPVDLAALVRAGFLVSDDLTFASTPAPEGAGLEERREEKKRTDKKARGLEMSPLFLQAWALYPARPGNGRQAAWAAWQARVAQGVTEQAMLDGVKGYASYCLRERTQPKFVMLGATFFGPALRFEDDYGMAIPGLDGDTVALYEPDGVTLTAAGRELMGAL
jgi:hypothetical protein